MTSVLTSNKRQRTFSLSHASSLVANRTLHANAKAANGIRAMNDDKRFLRELKRDLKKTGNRKRRRYLKDLSALPEDFDFGRNRSDVMNEQPKNKSRRPDEPAK